MKMFWLPLWHMCKVSTVAPRHPHGGRAWSAGLGGLMSSADFETEFEARYLVDVCWRGQSSKMH